MIFQDVLFSEPQVLTYPKHDDFEKYEGQVKDGKPQGRGNMTFRDGGFYFGEWQDGARHGKGNQKYSTDAARDNYDGSWKDDQEDGEGVLVFKNGPKYEGSMFNGFRHGKGFQTFAKDDVYDRASYEGEWNADKSSGNGTLIWKNGAKYVGGFLNDLRHGHGIETYPEDDTRLSYDGEWKEGEKSGNGTYIWKDGRKYVGEFKDDRCHGEGILYSATNEIINQGQWEKDSFIGK